MNWTPNVDADKLKEKFNNRLCGVYNTETYYIEDCTTDNSKYPISTQLMNYQLSIFLAENNYINDCGELVPYYEKGKVKFKVELCHLQEG